MAIALKMFKIFGKELSVKWKIFFYFLAFSLIMLLLLWLFQIVLLNDFYRTIKINELYSTAQSIQKNIESENLTSLIDSIAQKKDICLMLYDDSNQVIYSAEGQMGCIIHRIPASLLLSLSKDALEDKNEYFENFSPNNDQRSYFSFKDGRRNIPNSCLLVKKFENSSGKEYILALNSTIEPVLSTTSTLRTQLVCITLIMLILSFILSLLISKKISAPIVSINNSAKKLSSEYNLKFNETGYTEISELAKTLTDASFELSKVEDLRKELIANVSHDLRTPLTMITGYSEVMKDIPGENTPENIQIIIDEAKRLTSLVNDVLEVSGGPNNVQELNIKKFNLTDCIDKIVMRYKKLTEKDGYTITFEKDNNSVEVEADELRITQVIYNLVNNAITYTGEDKTVKIRQTVIDDKVKIEVIDSGDGIKEEEIKYIWERYYKAKGNHKRAHIGTGLGLAIVKNVLTLHKAEFGAKNNDDKGATFWFELPSEISKGTI